MAHYSLADAHSNLPSLVAKAENGEEVVIDRPNDVVVKLVVTHSRPSSPWDLAWLDAHRVHPRWGRVNTAQAFREMKEESPR